ncbi:hypothetical protein [Tepidibacter formicigenes]|jgi:hypothetical protein|uniref:DUF3794 domain-containing protein n=1 Tax=Tepidibacter formicigenes DSM 15518 TaxID=1123349 RepID=A0A1M6N242_9FIRM|nr:hypothetical protein [Tepidibacter formicigenes]SHJ89752.1 hypothetical protein SAMN02744037_01141 [Tepidibacter formicigenes DSM 15518]
MADDNKCLGFCCGCELIKTNRVLCEDDFTIPGPFTFFNTIDNPFPSQAVEIDKENTKVSIISTGCRTKFIEKTGKFEVTFLGFLICESIAIKKVSGGAPKIVEFPVSRICQDFTFTFKKCKIDRKCIEEGLTPKCQLESISGEDTLSIVGDNDGETIKIKQAIKNIKLEMKLDQIVQLLVQLCQQAPGTLTVK